MPWINIFNIKMLQYWSSSSSILWLSICTIALHHLDLYNVHLLPSYRSHWKQRAYSFLKMGISVHWKQLFFFISFYFDWNVKVNFSKTKIYLNKNLINKKIHLVPINYLISSQAYAISAERKNKLNPKEQAWIVQVYLEASKIKMMLSSESRVKWI